MPLGKGQQPIVQKGEKFAGGLKRKTSEGTAKGLPDQNGKPAQGVDCLKCILIGGVIAQVRRRARLEAFQQGSRRMGLGVVRGTQLQAAIKLQQPQSMLPSQRGEHFQRSPLHVLPELFLTRVCKSAPMQGQARHLSLQQAPEPLCHKQLLGLLQRRVLSRRRLQQRGVPIRSAMLAPMHAPKLCVGSQRKQRDELFHGSP